MRILLFLICFINVKAPAQNIPYGNNKAAGKYYSIRGIKMYCEIYGKGKPLLMIHGNGGSITDFSMNIGYFANNYKVIVPDMRSQGKTNDLADSLSYEMMADDIAALLDTLKIDSANIIGWSDGGIDAILLAIRHPRKVKTMAVTGANLWPGPSAIIESLVEEDKKRLAELNTVKDKTAAQKNEYKLLHLLLVHPNISLSQLSAIKIPAMVIAGDHDLIRLEHTLLIYQNIPKANLWIVPNSGHATLQEHKDWFNKAVNEFFTKSFPEKN